MLGGNTLRQALVLCIVAVGIVQHTRATAGHVSGSNSTPKFPTLITAGPVNVSREQPEAKTDVLLVDTSAFNVNVTKGCQCKKSSHSCSCCTEINIKDIHFDETGCVNVAYLKKDVGIAMSLTINGKVIINQTVSARNPPPICFTVPFVKHLASSCIHFYNLDIKHGFSGCIDLEMHFLFVFKETFHLGCFKIEEDVLENENISEVPPLKFEPARIRAATIIPWQKIWQHLLKQP